MSSQRSLESGALHPYDQPDGIEDPVPASDWAHAAARGVISNLEGRRGVGNELESYDVEIRMEIISEIAEIIRLARSINK